MLISILLARYFLLPYTCLGRRESGKLNVHCLFAIFKPYTRNYQHAKRSEKGKNCSYSNDVLEYEYSRVMRLSRDNWNLAEIHKRFNEDLIYVLIIVSRFPSSLVPIDFCPARECNRLKCTKTSICFLLVMLQAAKNYRRTARTDTWWIYATQRRRKRALQRRHGNRKSCVWFAATAPPVTTTTRSPAKAARASSEEVLQKMPFTSVNMEIIVILICIWEGSVKNVDWKSALALVWGPNVST